VWLLIAVFTHDLQAQDRSAADSHFDSSTSNSSEETQIGSCLKDVSSTGEVSEVGEASLDVSAFSNKQAEREANSFSFAIPGILEQHARMEYLMWRKHLYGTIYGGPIPRDNPLLKTEEQLAQYLDLVSPTAAPGGILIYWRSRQKHGGSSDLCVGLVLPGRRMLVEASPVSEQGKLKSLLSFTLVGDARLAVPRKAAVVETSTDLPLKSMDLTALSRALLPPSIADAFKKHRVKSLLIFPIEGIGEVPFAALPIANTSVLVDFVTVTLAPDFRALADLQGSDAKLSRLDRVLIVGDPDLTTNPQWIFPPLPGARLEAQRVASLFGQEPMLGKVATRQAVLTRLTSRPAPKLIYFATHAITDEVNPQDASFLALTGANLRTREIGKLALSGRPLVVLSACQTGLGKVFAEGGVFGMALAWHYAGAGTVIMSLWNVPDAATGDLMTEFSRLLETETPAEALASDLSRSKHY
jgi:hypothetical protein